MNDPEDNARYAARVRRYGFHSLASLRKAQQAKMINKLEQPPEWAIEMARMRRREKQQQNLEKIEAALEQALSGLYPRGLRQRPTFGRPRKGQIF